LQIAVVDSYLFSNGYLQATIVEDFILFFYFLNSFANGFSVEVVVESFY